ncbi:MAG: hypothetical protein JWR22_2848 [Herminiimonas sp.]|nr:hypothetical protein [Herminiimonas sp.]
MTDGPALDAEATVEWVIEQLEKNPPLSCFISFVGSLDQDMAERVALQVRIQALLLRDTHPWMNFARLRQVIFHHDYEQGIRDASADRPLSPAPTKEAGGLSIGMVFRSGDGVKLVMDEAIAKGLLSEVEKHRDLAVNALRHELCHVHDFDLKLGLMEKHPDAKGIAGFGSYFLPIAESLWDEYFANKYSCGPWTDIHQYSDFLCEVIPTIRADVIAAILTYRVSHDLAALRSVAEAKVRFIAQCFGYAMGTLAATGATLKEHSSTLESCLIKFDLLLAWDACFAALEALDQKRPHWDSVLELKQLIPPCVLLMTAFGLNYRPIVDGAYIEVLYTKEPPPQT